MAALDYATVIPGTSKTWKNTGGDGALTLTSLANNSGREGEKLDFNDATYGYPAWIDWRFETAVGSAATNGLQVELWVGESDNATAGTNNPANLTGADAGLSNPDELKLQATFVLGLNLSNARGTNVQKQWGRTFPMLRYQIPLVVNKSGQTLSGTAGNHTLVAIPYYYLRQA